MQGAGTHEKSYRTFVGNAIYVSVPGLIDPRVMYFRQKHVETGPNYSYELAILLKYHMPRSL